ncbi:hypothetical protein DOTSEDRAFT_72044 [Dothistroma septosporum NZE10]|uniref:Zinc knuckle-domain-containing protein n=1 Tax=Dothistroma septosporum (strain NZE10 / CBS 128990) TaxID=675120 RepID=N1PPX4_DOTSN|nr:hypothetical protein DOTSEDRAFT_72044 [Dothistroma septosporum NZE10]
MNRYRTGTLSQASATTTCQKCLKKGHYSYECTASKQDRPYVSRPSRSQQFSNPKLAPKLSAVLPPADPKPEVKNPGLVLEDSRSRKHSREEPTRTSAPKRRRSVLSYSSDSVSTISTSQSRSRSNSPPRDSRRRISVYREAPPRDERRRRGSSTGSRRRPSRPDSRTQSEQSPVDSRQRTGSSLRSSRKRSISPTRRDVRRSRSRSPYRGGSQHAMASRSRLDDEQIAQPPRRPAAPPEPARLRSLSPYSQRVAMTRAGNGS